jgi:hypothetical protein
MYTVPQENAAIQAVGTVITRRRRTGEDIGLHNLKGKSNLTKANPNRQAAQHKKGGSRTTDSKKSKPSTRV